MSNNHQSSRLQKLLRLLESSSDATRKAAAKQITDVAKAHPSQLPSVLRKVQSYLYSKNWDARIAAGETLQNIAEWFQHYSADDLERLAVDDHPVEGEPLPATCVHSLTFESFKLEEVLLRGTPLLASKGQEYEVAPDGGASGEGLQKQREVLKKRLGIGQALEMFMDMDDLMDDEDLAIGTPTPGRVADTVKQDASELLTNLPGLSARERNKLKRQAKRGVSRVDSLRRGRGDDHPEEGPSVSRGKAPLEGGKGKVKEGPSEGQQGASSSPPGTPSRSGDDAAAEDDVEEWKQIEQGAWPFQRLCNQLCIDILDPCWEVRHGAAVALRGILRTHAACACVDAPVDGTTSGWCVPGLRAKRRLRSVLIADVQRARQANEAWLEDCIVLLLCVLALDRLGDFASDQAAAPVRETAAQALGTALRPLPKEPLLRVLHILIDLKEYPEWEVRHGGLLGLKYLLAARLDVSKDLLPIALPALLNGIADPDDDVRAVAADALVPVASAMIELGQEHLVRVRTLLWGILEDLEELSAATKSVLQLLAHLYETDKGATVGVDLGVLIPRLWPFFRHTLTSVRISSMQCLQRLLASSSGGDQVSWLQPLVAPLLKLVFQNFVLEVDPRVLDCTMAVWTEILERCSVSWVLGALDYATLQGMLALASTPNTKALDRRLLVTAVRGNGSCGVRPRPSAKKPKVAGEGTSKAAPPTHVLVVPHSDPEAEQSCGTSTVVVGSSGEGTAVRMHLTCARAMGLLCAKVQGQDPTHLVFGEVYRLLCQNSATGRMVASMTVWFWQDHLGLYSLQSASEETPNNPILDNFVERSLFYLSGPGPSFPCYPAPDPYTEMITFYARMRKDMRSLVMAGIQAGWQLHMPPGYTVDTLVPEGALAVIATVPDVPVNSPVHGARQVAYTTTTNIQGYELVLHTSTVACIAAAVVQTHKLPPKLNTIIQPLMGSVRREQEVALQELSASALAVLIHQCTGRTPNPSEKILHNVCALATSDPAETPSVTTNDEEEEDDENAARRQTHAMAGPRGGKVVEDPQAVAVAVTRIGAEAVLREVTRVMGPGLWSRLPVLWEHMAAGLLRIGPVGSVPGAGVPTSATGSSTPSGGLDSVEPQVLVHNLQILKVLGPHLHTSLIPMLVDLLPHVAHCCQHSHPGVRKAAARCAAQLSSHLPDVVLPPLLRLVCPLLDNSSDNNGRMGAVQLVAHLVQHLGAKLVAYTVLLVVPLLRRMSDPLPRVRHHATSCFGSLVGLLPLAQGMALPSGLDQHQRAMAEEDSRFLIQLLDNKKVEDYVLPVAIKVKLRHYQQEGINWLAFLRRFGLHGVLADDMGLGKTLQAATIMAAATTEQVNRQQASGRSSDAPRPHLVVCPSTLVGHWVHEVSNYIPETVLRPLAYMGMPQERAQLQKKLKDHNLVVMSYEALRADVEWVASVSWDYCVLDEGHVIRSPKTKLAQACKRVVAQQRLILSGTPIQNNVLELWSLFDFLMPGFLGAERAFNAKFGKAVQAAKYSKKGSAESEAGLLAVDALHKQVMPFVLRRNKQQVLHDLPPKILQDITCDLSPLQAALYEDFVKSDAAKEVAQASSGPSSDREAAGGGNTKGATPHVFAALLYLRKLCSHPLMVIDWTTPQHQKAVSKVLHSSDWKVIEPQLHQLMHAPKLLALRDLLAQCGIINVEEVAGGAEGAEGESEYGASMGHRVLVFAQLKSTLDLVEQDVLQPHNVTYLRLDGSVDATQRFAVVQRFNSDPTIDVLLLTTHVGGLGLNLTSADTVIFLEHDWNPMKDLQAMDRAHRLGQTRTVNVYRLLMRNTLEERIMGLQRFKLEVAQSIVNQDNMSLNNMDTTQLLDMFAVEPTAEGADKTTAKPKRKSALQSMLESMGELWDESQYDREFNVHAFMQNLQNGSQ